MLVRRVLFFTAISALGSCTLPTATPESNTEKLIARIVTALGSPEVASYIPVGTVPILTALAKGSSGECGILFDRILESNEILAFLFQSENTGSLWSALVDLSFVKLALDESEDQEQEKQRKLYGKHAEHIVKSVVLPKHPLLSQYCQERAYQADFEERLGEFIEGGMQNFGDFIHAAVVNFFATKLAYILEHVEDVGHNAQREIRVLLHKYKQSMHRVDLQGKCACVFLMTVSIKDITDSLKDPSLRKDFLYANIEKLASTVHADMTKGPRQKIERGEAALKSVLLSNYPNAAQGELVAGLSEYELAIHQCYNKGRLVDAEEKVYRMEQVDPEELNEVITQVVETSLVKRLSPQCLTIMHGYQEDVYLCRIYLGHACQGLSLADVEGRKGDSSFWEGLIDEHFATFAQENNEIAQAIIEEVVLTKHPMLSKVTRSALLTRTVNQSIANKDSLSSFCERRVEHMFGMITYEVFTFRGCPIYRNRKAFYDFLLEYKDSMTYKDIRYEYAYQFLVKVPFECIESLLSKLRSREIPEDLRYFAREICCQSQGEYATEVKNALKSVCPDTYDRLAGSKETYDFVIDAYMEVERQVRDGVQPRRESIEAQEFKQIMRQSLEQFGTSWNLHPTKISILRALSEEESEPFASFLKFMYDQDISGRSIIMKHDKRFWSYLIEERFVQFAQHDRHAANEIVQKAMIAGHPFSDGLQALFSIDFIIRNPSRKLCELIDAIVERTVQAKLDAILKSQATEQRENEFRDLMDKYRRAYSVYDENFEVSYEFLMKFPFEEVKHQLEKAPEWKKVALDLLITQLPATLYLRIWATSREKFADAQYALESLSPHAYHQCRDKQLTNVIHQYTRLKVKKIDGKEFRSIVEAALGSEKILKELHAVYLTVLRAFSKTSPLYQQFFEYTFQNYAAEPYGNMTENGHLKWSRLIDEYLYTFMMAYGQIYLENAREIIIDVAKSVYPLSDRAQSSWGTCMPAFTSDLRNYISSRVMPVFIGEWSEMLNISESDAGQACEKLLWMFGEYAGNSSGPTEQFKYACAFLIKCPISHVESLVAAGFVSRTRCNSVESFSEQAFGELHRWSPGDARHLLRSLLPNVYNSLGEDRSYGNVMQAYVKSGMEPEYRFGHAA